MGVTGPVGVIGPVASGGAGRAGAAVGGAGRGEGVSAPAARAATIAAPRATACFGCVSTATGRPRPEDTSSATRGIRELPPTSSTWSTASAARPADRSARSSAVTVSASVGRIISSSSARVTRTCVCTDGSSTGTRISLSSDSPSLACVHSMRSRDTAARAWGSSGSSDSYASSTEAVTRENSAASTSMPPRRSIPSGEPRIVKPPSASLRSTAASNVPPPRSYTATTAPSSTRSCDA